MGEGVYRGLEGLRYSYKGTNILPERHYFSKGEPRTHQIHMYQKDSLYLKQQLAFRDYLMTNETALKEYQALKDKLSKTYYKDKWQYADAKTEFVNSILEKLGFIIK
jgi:GrpB-like predicted nucleotidyltransferase (UPF0157 family)